MLDLIILASAVAVTRYISKRNPFLPQSSSPTSSNTAGISGNSQHSASVVAASEHDPSHRTSSTSTASPAAVITGSASNKPGIDRAARSIFHITLLASLVLFSLSILEAAPISWLVLGFDDSDSDSNSTSSFVSWYRAVLWALCILLLFVHPAFLGVILGASVFRSKGASYSNYENDKPAASPTSASPSRKNSSFSSPDGSRARKKSSWQPLIICFKIVWISIRFILVSIVWRLFLRCLGSIIPYRITRADGNRNSKRGNEQRSSSWQSFGMLITAMIMLIVSFFSMATIGSLVLHYDTDDSIDGFNTGGQSVPFREQYNLQHEYGTSTTSVFDYVCLKCMVSVICAFGMVIASVLNGFGCASLPHSNVVGVFLEPTPLSVIAKVEEDYCHAMKTLEEKRWMLTDVMEQPTISPGATRATRLPSFSYTPSKNKPFDEKQRMEQLQQEVLFLESLVGDMADDINEMKQSQQLALAARTAMGRVKYVLGVIFSIILVVRVILAASSFLPILEGRGSDDSNNYDGNNSNGNNNSNRVQSFSHSRDPLTSISLWLLGRNIVNVEQYDLFRQATSLVLAGALSVSQVRNFFRVVGALGRRLSRTCGGGSCISAGSNGGLLVASPLNINRSSGNGNSNSNNVALLVASFVMGCYFLACAVVIKMNLPIEYRSSFSTAVGLNFNFNTRLLNMVFFGSACVTAATLASLFGIQRNNLERYRLDSRLSPLSLSSSFQLA